jgi:serine/threonine protein kinase
MGLVIMEAVSGKFPLYNEDQGGDLTFWQLMKYLTEKDIPTLGESFSEELRDFVSKCLRKQGGTRPTAGELLKHPFTTKYEKIDQRHLKKWI